MLSFVHHQPSLSPSDERDLFRGFDLSGDPLQQQLNNGSSISSIQQLDDSGSGGEDEDYPNSFPDNLNGSNIIMSGHGGIVQQPKRAQVPKACANCRKMHAACGIERPCKRCITNGLEASCVDIPRKKRASRKRVKSDIESSSSSSENIISLTPNNTVSNKNNTPNTPFNNAAIVTDLTTSMPLIDSSSAYGVSSVKLWDEPFSPTDNDFFTNQLALPSAFNFSSPQSPFSPYNSFPTTSGTDSLLLGT